MTEVAVALRTLHASELHAGYFRFTCPACGEDSASYEAAVEAWYCTACTRGGSQTDLTNFVSAGGTGGPTEMKRHRGNRARLSMIPTPRINVINGINGLMAMETIQPEAVRWVWPPRIALGKVTVLEGDPDQGKSLMTVDLAARLSRGAGMPDGATADFAGPAATVLLTAEDGLADTVRPRLEAAGAVLSRVHVLESVPGDDGDARPPELPRDIPYLRQAITYVGARLVVIDVVMAYLSGEVKALADQDIRRALRPLAKLAEELNVAIVALRHLTKGGGANPMYRGGGAIGLGAAARSVLLAGNDPKQPGRHLLARVKGNLAPPYPALGYEIVADIQSRPMIRWLGPSETTALEILAAAADSAREANADTGPEVMFLQDVLANGEQSAKEILSSAHQHGLKDRPVWRASQRLGVQRRRVGFGPEGQWLWRLPDTIDSIDSIDSDGRNQWGKFGDEGAEEPLPW